MKKVIYVLVFVVVMFLFLTAASCESEPNAEQNQTLETNKILNEINAEIGLPNILNFQQKKLMKVVYELCDKENLICYAYIKADYSGELKFLGKCMGFGIPFSAQYTSPEKVVEGDHMLGRDLAGINYLMKVPQADPNGLYMPTSSSATWLPMIDPNTGEVRPAYIEFEIAVFPFKL